MGPRAVEALRSREAPVGSWYLDLSGVEKYWGQERTYHHTAPISANYALYEALRLVAEEGLEQVWQRHADCARKLWDGLQEIDLTMLVPEEARMITVTTVRVPDGVDELAVRARLRDEHGIAIAGGLGEFKGIAWRIGLMGHSARNENVELLLSALEDILHS